MSAAEFQPGAETGAESAEVRKPSIHTGFRPMAGAERSAEVREMTRLCAQVPSMKAAAQLAGFSRRSERRPVDQFGVAGGGQFCLFLSEFLTLHFSTQPYCDRK